LKENESNIDKVDKNREKQEQRNRRKLKKGLKSCITILDWPTIFFHLH